MANLFILDRVSEGAHYYDAVAPATVTNGNFVVLGAEGTDGTYTVAAPAAITDLGMCIVCNPNIAYAAETVENDVTIATGEVIRVRVPQVGDKESYPVANFTATATVTAGHYVIPDAAALKGEAVSSLGGTESIVYIIDRIFTKAGVSMAQIRCIKA